MFNDVVIISGARTPVGSFGGALKDVPLVHLGALVLKTSLKKANLRPQTGERRLAMGPNPLQAQGKIELEQQYDDYAVSSVPVQVDEVVMGNVVAAGQGQNVTRQAAVYGGIPKETPAYTVNKLCASGMKAISLAAQAIACGSADVVLAGGMENMSRIPYALSGARWGARMGNTAAVDLLIYDGLLEIFHGYHMGMTAENIAAQYGISRRDQDELGVLSHQRALQAIAAGAFHEEIVPVPVPQRRGSPLMFDTDERPMETTLEKMAALKPAFKKDGSVTAGNASGINDAAAALLLMNRRKATDLGLTPQIKIRACASAGVDPAYMGLGPIPAIRKLLATEKLALRDFDLIELNEAFAVQVLACIRELGLDLEKVNPLGSGISIGHPIGCTGARITLTLMHQMIRNHLNLGLAALCVGGGMGMALVLERI